MPFRPSHSLLNVNLETMHLIDTRSVEDLFGLWAVFSKTSNALEDGKRLENLSWRLWTRETFCCSPETKSRSQSTTLLTERPFPPRGNSSSIPKVPELASSLETVSSCDSDDAADSSLLSHPSNVARPELTRLDTCESRSRGREKHITPNDLEKMVVSIKQKQHLEPLEPLPLPAPIESEQLPATTTQEQPKTNSSTTNDEITPVQDDIDATPMPQGSSLKKTESSAETVATGNESAGDSSSPSNESSSTAMSTHSVVRGFVPGGVPSSYRSQTHLAAQPTPILKNSPRAHHSATRTKGAMFTLGTSSGEEESSLDSNMYRHSVSSISGSLNKPPPTKKQASFRDDNLVSNARHNPVFDESDDEDDDDDEAVSDGVFEDDEDSSDWEDEGDDDKSDGGESSYFQRVDSRPNLTSHRSLLTSLMHEGDRAKALQNAASRSTPALRRSRATSPSGPSMSSSPQRESLLAANTRGNSGAQPIVGMTSNAQQISLSPRTTRRNMLSSELTESLRKNLLWERQHKSSQNLAAIKRRHTSTDVKNLKQHPEPPNLSSTANFNNDYFHAGLGEFHSKGW